MREALRAALRRPGSLAAGVGFVLLLILGLPWGASLIAGVLLP